MNENEAPPIIFPLSNPTSRSAVLTLYKAIIFVLLDLSVLLTKLRRQQVDEQFLPVGHLSQMSR
jgi:hypothetical protein